MTRRMTLGGRLGIVMMTGSLATGALLFTPAVAEEIEAEVTKAAVYQHPRTKVAPEILTSEVPPGAVCVVRPDLCPDAISPVTDPIPGAIDSVQDGERDNPPPQAQVGPGQIAVSLLGGQPDYHAGIFFELPPIPEGQTYETVVIKMQEAQPTYHSNSPAFRQAVLAAAAQIREDSRGPSEFEKILSEQPVDSMPIMVEACPFTEEFADGVGQSSAEIPGFECLFGATGVRDDSGEWSFNLNFAAGAWADGTLPYQGVYFRPADAQNLAYGDKDPSTQSRVTFQVDTVTLEVPFVAAAAPPPAFQPQPQPQPTTQPAPPPSTGGSSGGFTPTTSAPIVTEQPQTSEPAVVAPPAQQPAAPAAPPVAAPLPINSETPGFWYIWLLLPVFAGGMYMTAQALTAPVEVVAATSREGAMTRLIERQKAAGQGMRPGAPRLVQL